MACNCKTESQRTQEHIIGPENMITDTIIGHSITPFIEYYIHIVYKEGLPSWLSGKESASNAGATGDAGSNPRSRRSPGGGNGNPFQYSCPEKISWTEKPGGLQSMGLQRADVTERLSTSTNL